MIKTLGVTKCTFLLYVNFPHPKYTNITDIIYPPIWYEDSFKAFKILLLTLVS